MELTKPFEALALSLQEAALELSHDDIRKGLSDCLNDMYPGQYCYVADVFGDAESGDVIYQCGGEYLRATYDIGTVNGKRTHAIDTENATNVLPRTVYDEEADEDDHMAGMAEADRIERFPGALKWLSRPLSERFISKAERDGMDSADFAGSGRSFPIKKPGDIMAAVRSIGRGVAGGQSATSIKNKIKAIAKRKGWAKSLPKAWQDEGDSKEADAGATADGIRLVESAHFADPIEFKESGVSNPIAKIISPGRGSSGYYTKEMLMRDGPKIFTKGTLGFINHATAAEEAERPEGDWSKIGFVTTGNAYWDEAGKAGPALYAPVLLNSKYAPEITELAPHTGLSIRARGQYAESKTGIPSPTVKYEESKLAPDGKPGLIGTLTHADSIDLVTKAGRDGKLLLESATQRQETEMDKAEIQALITEAVKTAVAPLQADNTRLRETIARQSAPQVVAEALRDIRLPGPVHVVEATRQRIIRTLAAVVPINETGAVDTKKLNEMVEAEALHEAQHLASLGFGEAVAGIGKRMTEAELREQHVSDGKEHAQQYQEALGVLADLFVGPKLEEDYADAKVRVLRDKARKTFVEGRAA